MPGNAKPGKIKSPGNAKPSGQIKIEDIQIQSATPNDSVKPPMQSSKPTKAAESMSKKAEAKSASAKSASQSAKTAKPEKTATAVAKPEKSVKNGKSLKQTASVEKGKKPLKSAKKATLGTSVEKKIKTQEKPKPKAEIAKKAVKKAVEKTKTAKTTVAKTAKPEKAATAVTKPGKSAKSATRSVKTVTADKNLPKPSLKEQKPSDKPVQVAVRQKANPAVKKSDDKASQISLFDPTTFDQTVRDMEITYISMLSYVGKLYIGHFAKSGFGGGIDSVLSDVTEYIAHGLKELGKKGDKAIAERLCKTVFRTTGDGWQGGVPLALKITVAMDLHGGSKYTKTLCSDIQRIYELAKIAGVTRSQAREMIGGLITFAVGQGIDIK